ncbi:sialate O-acetylesterase [Polaribacter sp. 20A6]|uniref:sialate O-acetylesterase n=1 Tax=Polaribacter sp. 20A6 TaxID=2687289 RepID=UPI0013FE0C07|nr:sialate O-acetylesterase [Polaribacter sp. 20A6]
MKNHYQFLLILLFVLPKMALANVSLNSLFSDHMVIQRETIIPIWGWADANEIITVETSWGASAQVITNLEGNWRADIKTPEAGGPHTITVFSKNKIVINDVLSGDVWLCTGQSNMDFGMSKFLNDARDPKHQPLVTYIRNEVKTANDNWIRHIEVPQTTSLFEKKKNFKGNWVSVNREDIGKITATGYFFAKEIRKQVDVPIGLLECSWGGTRIQPWLSEEAYLANENMKAYFEASRVKSKAAIKKMEAKDYVDLEYQKKIKIWTQKGEKGRKPKPLKNPKDDMQLEATLHNGMLSSIIPFAIKGSIWYQGESNAEYLPQEYENYLTTMIDSWRSEWAQGDFPFYWTQLAACNRGSKKKDLGWSIVNDQLRKTLKVKNTGMAVLYDIGEPKDIHPHNKMDVGKRLALWALKKDYNIRIPAVSGPLYQSKKIVNNKIQIKFKEVGSGLMIGSKVLLNKAIAVNEPLKRFEILSEKGIWEQAKAKIISKNKIEVWSENILNPKEVRYAWAANPEGANLYNIEGLPAAIFSSEK